MSKCIVYVDLIWENWLNTYIFEYILTRVLWEKQRNCPVFYGTAKLNQIRDCYYSKNNYTIRRGIQSQVEWHKDQVRVIYITWDNRNNIRTLWGGNEKILKVCRRFSPIKLDLKKKFALYFLKSLLWGGGGVGGRYNVCKCIWRHQITQSFYAKTGAKQTKFKKRKGSFQVK